MSNQKEIAGLILSAGFSRRMGSFKPLMKLNGTEFINSAIDKLLLVCNKIVIVTGHKSEELIESVNAYLLREENLKFQNNIFLLKNENPAEGMFSSLKIGVSELKDYEWILYHFVDQPQIPKLFYPEFVKQADDNYDWIQPVYDGKKGHPILFNKNLVSRIIKSKKGNLKEISSSKSIKKKFWECNYSEVLKDFDRPEDLD